MDVRGDTLGIGDVLTIKGHAHDHAGATKRPTEKLAGLDGWSPKGKKTPTDFERERRLREAKKRMKESLEATKRAIGEKRVVE